MNEFEDLKHHTLMHLKQFETALDVLVEHTGKDDITLIGALYVKLSSIRKTIEMLSK